MLALFVRHYDASDELMVIDYFQETNRKPMKDKFSLRGLVVGILILWQVLIAHLPFVGLPEKGDAEMKD